MKNYYIGNDVKNPTRIRTRITAGKFVPDIYVVTLSDNPGNILEILPAGMLVQRSARATCPRSEEHTSELQSHHDLVCSILLDKK